MVYKIVALVIILLIIVVDYAMLVTASRSDKRAERMYREWKEEHDE